MNKKIWDSVKLFLGKYVWRKIRFIIKYVYNIEKESIYFNNSQ